MGGQTIARVEAVQDEQTTGFRSTPYQKQWPSMTDCPRSLGEQERQDGPRAPTVQLAKETQAFTKLQGSLSMTERKGYKHQREHYS